MAVDRFSIGFGRAHRSAGRDKHGVEWRIGWIPLGGYVRFAGDENAASVPDDAKTWSELRQRIVDRAKGEAALSDRYFHFKPSGQRALVVAAGPVANFSWPSCCSPSCWRSVGETSSPPRIGVGRARQPGRARPASRPATWSSQADGRQIDDFLDVQQLRDRCAPTMPIDFVVERGGRPVALTATPERTRDHDQLDRRRRSSAPSAWRSRPAAATSIASATRRSRRSAGGAERTWDVLNTTVFYLGRMVTRPGVRRPARRPAAASPQPRARPPRPAPRARRTWRIAARRLVALLSLAAVLSVGIGFMNLLPVPVLDGGHLLFYAYEAVARRPLGARVQAAGYRVGLACCWV